MPKLYFENVLASSNNGAETIYCIFEITEQLSNKQKSIILIIKSIYFNNIKKIYI